VLLTQLPLPSGLTPPRRIDGHRAASAVSLLMSHTVLVENIENSLNIKSLGRYKNGVKLKAALFCEYNLPHHVTQLHLLGVHIILLQWKKALLLKYFTKEMVEKYIMTVSA
jgi:hypothetical protein